MASKSSRAKGRQAALASRASAVRQEVGSHLFDQMRALKSDADFKRMGEIIKQVDLEHSRAPEEGSHLPYVAAMRQLIEADPEKALRLIAEADAPPAIMAAYDPPGTPGDQITGLFQGLGEFEKEAASQLVSLVNQYQYAEQNALARFQQLPPDVQTRVLETSGNAAVAFQGSPQAQSLWNQAQEILLTNPGLMEALDIDIDAGMSGLLDRVTLTDSPMPYSAPQFWATRADMPMDRKVSTYAGSDAADNYNVPDEPLRGKPVNQLRELAGAEVKDILRAAGFTEDQILGSPAPGGGRRGGMSTREMMNRVTEFRDPAAQTTRVRGPDGQVVEVGLEDMLPEVGGREGRQPRVGKTLSGLDNRIAHLQGLPVVEGVGTLDQIMDPPRGDFSEGPIQSVPSEGERASLIRRLQEQRDILAQQQAGQPLLDAILSQAEANPNPRIRGAFGDRAEDQLRQMESPSGKLARVWSEAAMGSTGLVDELTVDPVTGRPTYAGEDPNYFRASMDAKEPPELPSFLYGLFPEVDAAGGVTHPERPLDGNAAAKLFGGTIGAQTPEFAERITPLMQQALDQQWSVDPRTAGRRGKEQFADPNFGGGRRQHMPGPEGMRYLVEQAGGDPSTIPEMQRPMGNRHQPTGPVPSFEELEGMVGETPPPPFGPSPDGQPQMGPSTQPSVDDINRMLSPDTPDFDIPVEGDISDLLSQFPINRRSGQDILASLLA